MASFQEKILFGGLSIGAAIGIVAVVSNIQTNILRNKVYRAMLAKLQSEGFTGNTWLDNMFNSIEEKVGLAAGQNNSQQTSQQPNPAPATKSADGVTYYLPPTRGRMGW